MTKLNGTLTVNCITHGKHHKGGNTLETYDGALTSEAREALAHLSATPEMEDLRQKSKQLLVPAYCGIMNRHIETAEDLGFGINYITWRGCGDDEMVFNEGFERVKEEWLCFLRDCRGLGKTEVTCIVSKIQVFAMAYTQYGGEPTFGGFNGFTNTCDTLAGIPGNSIPMFAQAHLTRWEVTFQDNQILSIVCL